MTKKCITGFIEPLTDLINKSFSEGIFPTELKLAIARVVPILKAGDPMFLTNYRPISILTFFSKIFEELMYCNIFYKKILSYLTVNLVSVKNIRPVMQFFLMEEFVLLKKIL